MQKKLSPFLSAFWHLAKPYWYSEERWKARGLFFLGIILSLGIIWVNVQLNTWKGDFYNSLQTKNLSAFKTLILQFSGWAFLFILFSVYQLYFNQMLQIRWRRWLTNVYLKEWMDKATHYRLSTTSLAVDNPDQRIAEDFKLFVDNTLTLFFGLLSAVISFISFVGILWSLSGTWTIGHLSIPGYMVWVAITYAAIGSFLAHRFGRPLIRLNIQQQHYEADFRFALVRARENSEGIALSRNEAYELNVFQLRFKEVVQNWWSIMKQQKRFSWFSSFYGQLAIIFPMLVAAPRFFAGQLTLGGLMQINNAFDEVQKALSWFIDSYPQFAEWQASILRLEGFIQGLHHTQQLQEPYSAILSKQYIALAADIITSPEGKALVTTREEQIYPGQHTIITGPSGIGKSTLFKVLADIWPFKNEKIIRPPNEEVLFLPQRPYLPLGSLYNILSSFKNNSSINQEELERILYEVHLPYLISELHKPAYWAQRLSPGEQQRLALAKALLFKPRWLFLDEATSALEAKMEEELYFLLKRNLPYTTLISIAHRENLRVFHQQEWRLSRKESSDSDSSESAIIQVIPFHA